MGLAKTPKRLQPIHSIRSDTVKRGFERAPHRSLLKATGAIRSDGDFDKPFIGICNSYVDLIPGHVHLHAFGQVAREAVREAGGVPFEFNTIGVDDGIAMGRCCAGHRADEHLKYGNSYHVL